MQCVAFPIEDATKVDPRLWTAEQAPEKPAAPFRLWE
jgi:hypothetical protein